MKVVRVRKDIFHLKFNSQQELAETFLRFQEHYESPKYRGKVFTLGEFRKWYTDVHGSFSYYQD